MSNETLRHPWQLVAQREISTKLRDKTFLGSTAFMLIVVLAATIIPALISGMGGKDKIAVLDEAGTRIVAVADAIKGGDSYEATRTADVASAEQLVKSGEVKAALLPGKDGFEVLGKQRVETDLQNNLREAAVNLGMEQNAARAGLTPEQLRAGTQVQERLLDPGPLPEIVAGFVNIGLALIFYLTALSFGMMIAQSVVQEKESRVVEILAAAIPIRALLWGKVIGNTVLALGQIVVIAVA
jgi:ABC-2 type transport system permease protein